MPILCDKCHKPVEPANDAVLFKAFFDPDTSATALILIRRHLLPTAECLGSPSLAQYLPGQPRDQRPEYRISDEDEFSKLSTKAVRAYELLQQQFRNNKAK